MKSIENYEFTLTDKTLQNKLFLIIKKITVPLQRKWCYTQLRVAIGFTPPERQVDDYSICLFVILKRFVSTAKTFILGIIKITNCRLASFKAL